MVNFTLVADLCFLMLAASKQHALIHKKRSRVAIRKYVTKRTHKEVCFFRLDQEGYGNANLPASAIR